MSTGPNLAEFNWGILRHDWDDPRIADFQNNVDRVNALAERTDGFIWRLDDEAMEAAQHDPSGPLGGNPRMASTLSVWRDADALEHFVFNTIHHHFLSRADEWFAPQGIRLVLWWVPAGHRPSLAEAVQAANRLKTEGDSAQAFGWRYLCKHRHADKASR